MSELIVVHACSTFCSLLLSKPLVLLEIPQLKGVMEKCGKSAPSCCSKKKDIRKIAEKEVFNMIKSLDQKEIKTLKTFLTKGSNSDGINILFEQINTNIII